MFLQNFVRDYFLLSLWEKILAIFSFLPLCFNPKRPGLFLDVLFGEMKFVLSNCVSSQDLSILYESRDVQLTFDTLLNAFRFKAKPLGGAKFKN